MRRYAILIITNVYILLTARNDNQNWASCDTVFRRFAAERLNRWIC